jgi:leucyl aminopeptidase
MCYGPEPGPVNRVLLFGLGKRASFTPAALRDGVAGAVRHCRGLHLSRLGLAAGSLDLLEGPEERPRLLQDSVIAALLAAHSFTAYRSGEALETEELFSPAALDLLYAENELPARDSEALNEAVAVAEGMMLTRDLINGPANVVTPAYLADVARALAGRHGFSCRVLGPEELRARGMGALLAVASGSRAEPRFIILEHAPKGLEDSAPLVLVGKGVTFDSGGISLKPAQNMHKMKGDMAGAAAVLGVFEALGRTAAETPRRVIGLMPCAENMPGGRASRPGDIVTTLSGKTVEIGNTDAEGRLLLCDALSFAQQEWTPAMLVDIATLTGACVVALGYEAAGLYCDHAALKDALYALGEKNGDTFWPMPLWKSSLEKLKSAVADLANVGPREGGSIHAAVFLRQFVADGLPWAHLDIAGPGYALRKTPLCPEGGTGFGVRTLYSLARKELQV